MVPMPDQRQLPEDLHGVPSINRSQYSLLSFDRSSAQLRPAAGDHPPALLVSLLDDDTYIRCLAASTRPGHPRNGDCSDPLHST